MASLLRSTGTIALSTLISRILGFVREMLFAGFFGASGATDAFFIAFRIPNLLRRLVAEGAMTASFIPVYTDYLVTRSEAEALKVAQKTFTILMIVISFLVFLGIIFSPEIVSLFAYGINDEKVLSLAVDLNRIMFPFLYSVGFVAFAMGVLNSHGYFLTPAFAPVLLNTGIIIGIVFFSGIFSEPLYGVALGVILGGAAQSLVQIPFLFRSGFRFKISLDFRHPGIIKIFRMLGPALFGNAVYQINILMNTMLASMLAAGSISYLYYSDRLTEIVLGIFIISIGNVILPEMSRMSAMNDYKKLKSLYLSSIKASLFVAIPAAAALMAAGFPIISVIYMRGRFTPADAELTCRALYFASMGIISVSILRITAPTFYSLKDTRLPVLSAAAAFTINISLGYLLMRTELRHAGLALANTISVTVQMLLLVIMLQKKIGAIDFRSFFVSLVKYGIASAVMVLLIMEISGRYDWVKDVTDEKVKGLALIVVSGGVTYAVMCFVLKVEEMLYLVQKIKIRLQKKY